MESILKAGILGLGHMGRRHAQYLSSIPEVRIESICSIPLEDTQAFIKEELKEAILLFDDFHKMIESVPLDILYICLPPFAHNGEFEAAAKKGISIFIEKPIALDTNRGASMVNAALESGIVTQVGYHMRFGSAVIKLKNMILDGSAGMPVLFDGHYECNSLHAPWWRDVKKSGGQVFEQVIHLYDLALYLLGRPSIVSGHTANLCHSFVDHYTIEDNSVSSIRFESGALAAITGTNCAVPGEWNSGFKVVCEKLTAYFKSYNEAEFVFTESGFPHRVCFNKDCDPYKQESISFINAVLGKGPQEAGVKEGLLGLKVVEAVVTSSKKDGMPVHI